MPRPPLRARLRSARTCRRLRPGRDRRLITGALAFATLALAARIFMQNQHEDDQPEAVPVGAALRRNGRGEREGGGKRLHVFLHGFAGPADPDLLAATEGQAECTTHRTGRNVSGGASRLRRDGVPVCQVRGLKVPARQESARRAWRSIGQRRARRVHDRPCASIVLPSDRTSLRAAGDAASQAGASFQRCISSVRFSLNVTLSLSGRAVRSTGRPHHPAARAVLPV